MQDLPFLAMKADCVVSPLMVLRHDVGTGIIV
jgi:hypothetical protein